MLLVHQPHLLRHCSVFISLPSSFLPSSFSSFFLSFDPSFLLSFFLLLFFLFDYFLSISPSIFLSLSQSFFSSFSLFLSFLSFFFFLSFFYSFSLLSFFPLSTVKKKKEEDKSRKRDRLKVSSPLVWQYGDSFDMIEAAVASFLTECQVTLSRDPANYVTDAEGKSVLKPEISDDVCSVFCHRHGHCVRGQCICDAGYAGDNCHLLDGQGPQLARIRRYRGRKKK